MELASAVQMLGLMTLGGAFLFLAVLLLAEYRRAFFNDPRSVMSLEVLLNILKLGGPGYVAMIAVVAGVPMFLAGTVFFVLFAGFWVFDNATNVLRAISQTLGLG
jgi:hypothetical protein